MQKQGNEINLTILVKEFITNRGQIKNLQNRQDEIMFIIDTALKNSQDGEINRLTNQLNNLEKKDEPK